MIPGLSMNHGITGTWGTEAALAIRDQGVTLEEYLNEEY